MSKKGMEMSVNVLVGIILGIAMLAASMLLFFKLMHNVDKTDKTIDEEMKAKVAQALDNGDPVYVPDTNVEVVKGFARFVVGIRNINEEPKNFNITITLLDPENVPANFDTVNGIAFLPGPYNIPAKEDTMQIISVNMNHVMTNSTHKASLLVKAEIQENGAWVQYQKPRIVYIQQ